MIKTKVSIVNWNSGSHQIFTFDSKKEAMNYVKGFKENSRYKVKYY